jgi:mono/diheme cytochrome c family protein
MKSNIQSLVRCATLTRTFAIAAALGMGAAAWADEASDIREGQDLAAKVCSPCHAVAAPPGLSFAEIAKGTHAAPDALRALLTSTQSDVSHPYAMPNPELTERQIDEISAYLGSLRGAK